MVFSSFMMYFVICITVVRAYADSVLTDETTCAVLNSTLTKDINCGSDCWRSSKYPCLQVYVSLNATGRTGLLSHNEEMLDLSSEMPEGPHRLACYDPEYLGASEDAPAGDMLPRLRRASGQHPLEPSVWQQYSLPLSLLALLHVIWRNPHHTHGQAHSVPFHTV